MTAGTDMQKKDITDLCASSLEVMVALTPTLFKT